MRYYVYNAFAIDNKYENVKLIIQYYDEKNENRKKELVRV